jgi:two-component system response regulator
MQNKMREVEILLVEDNMDDAALIIHALRRVNLANHLMHLKDSAEAIEFIFGTGAYTESGQKERLQVILLAIKMPWIDGIEVLRRIRGHDVTKLIPVAIITSSAEEQEIIKNYALDENSFVVQPIDFKSFAKAIKALSGLAVEHS